MVCWGSCAKALSKFTGQEHIYEVFKSISPLVSDFKEDNLPSKRLKKQCPFMTKQSMRNAVWKMYCRTSETSLTLRFLKIYTCKRYFLNYILFLLCNTDIEGTSCIFLIHFQYIFYSPKWEFSFFNGISPSTKKLTKPKLYKKTKHVKNVSKTLKEAACNVK